MTFPTPQKPNVSGSFSWLLVNNQGTTDMIPGEMDIVFRNGKPLELTQAVLVLDQRVRKSTIEPQGSNAFAANWGSILKRLVGRKNLQESTLKDVARSIEEMFVELILLQTEAQERLDLEPAELIAEVDMIVVTTRGTRVDVSATIVTQASTIEEILIPGAFSISAET